MTEGFDYSKLAAIANNIKENQLVPGLMDGIMENQQRTANPVIDVCKALKRYIEDFESGLDEEHEVAVRLVSFGGEFVFHAQGIGYSMPNVITFTGVTEEGEKVQLVQHVSQLSMLLKAAKRIGATATRVTFH